MNIINKAIDAFRFKDTCFYKENSDLQNKYEWLKNMQMSTQGESSIRPPQTQE